MQQKLSLPLILGILATVAFNLAPIWLGYGMRMNACFVPYALLICILSLGERRVLGYATLLTACNPANAYAYVSFSLLMAVVTLFAAWDGAWTAARELRKHPWWCLSVAALLGVVITIPFWQPNLRLMVWEAKVVCSRLGYLVLVPLAIRATVRSSQDGVRALSFGCLMAVTVLAMFYLGGTQGVPEGLDAGMDSSGLQVMYTIGQAMVSAIRTQFCIVVAALAVASLSLAVTQGMAALAIPLYAASGLCVFMIMRAASTGSAFAMVCGMGVLAVAYLSVRPSLGRVLFGFVVFAAAGYALMWAVFSTDNLLAERIVLKVRTARIDRWQAWVESIDRILVRPIGSGWTTTYEGRENCHNDFFIYFLSYGWITGACYAGAVATLFVSLVRQLTSQTARDAARRTLLLTGLSALTVYVANSMLDMLSANTLGFDILWAVVFTAAATVYGSGENADQALTDAAGSADWQPELAVF